MRNARDAYCEIAGKFVGADGEAARFGPTRSTFMITVIDQASPWLIPSNALAAIIQPQLGAHMIMNAWDGKPDKPAEDENTLPAPGIGKLA